MNIVDSSAWLAYFADEPNAKHFLPPLNDPDALIVPTVTIYEVFKVVLRESGEDAALQAAMAMHMTCRWRTALFWPRRGNSMPSSGPRMLILKI
jgi:uncharacterized protein with PIN domain